MTNASKDISNTYQKKILKFSIIAFVLFGIAAIAILVFILLSDGTKSESTPNLSDPKTFLHARNETMVHGPVHRPAPAEVRD